MKKLGFIGCGNMAGAILSGGIRSGFLLPENTWVYDVQTSKVQQMQKELGIHPAASLSELASQADILLMGVKPDVVETVLKELIRCLSGEVGNEDPLAGKALLSIALGYPYARYRELLGPKSHICFVMPNTPCKVLEGMSLIEESNSFDEEELAFAKGLFGSIGQVEMMKSSLMEVGGALSGCGPAFVYLFIEALADGAVYYGMPRDMAYRLAAQTLCGAGKMVLETHTHPGALKDSVCSPGGSTIRGVKALEDGALRSTVMNAIKGAMER